MYSDTARRRKKCKKHTLRVLILSLLLDLLLAGSIVGGDYLYSYKIPYKLAATNITTTAQGASFDDAAGTISQKESTSGGEASVKNSGTGQWREKFKSHFSNRVISTDTVYKSPNISVELKKMSYDSGIKDTTENGNHVKYGTKIAYTLADIYVSDISCLQTAFAQDTYGVGYSEGLSAMSLRMKSVLATNGDSYSNNRHQDNGTIIRNGTVYRTKSSTEETCVLFRDGTMKIYTPETFSAQKVIADGAWQSWAFGPGLLDKNGAAKTDFLTWNYITESHPRTAIGYYEPGHYCLLVVDGRQPNYSRGMFLNEMSQLFADLGCKAAYNLDGGHCSFMTKDSAVAGHPYRPGKDISDGIFLCEPGGLQ